MVVTVFVNQGTILPGIFVHTLFTPTDHQPMLYCFDSAQAMSDHQTERELLQALQVQDMTPDQRWLWLEEVWGRLQNSAALFRPDNLTEQPEVRFYASLDEKNRFDDEREISRALQLPMHAGTRS